MLQPSTRVLALSSVERMFLLFSLRISNSLPGKVQSTSCLQELRSLLFQLFARLPEELRGEFKAALA